jgi:hypothetical protein
LALLSATFSSAVYTPSDPLVVTLLVTPGASLNYAVEEEPPAGWSVADVNEGGFFAGGRVRWGPFADGAARTLSYTATPPAGASGAVTFAGAVGYDSDVVAVSGARTITNLYGDVDNNQQVDEDDLLTLLGHLFGSQLAVVPDLDMDGNVTAADLARALEALRDLRWE